MNSFYPRLRTAPDRPDHNGMPGGHKPADPPDALTEGQVDFLQGLTDRQRERLERQPRLRAGLLPWFHNGPDRILYHEAMRLLGSYHQDPPVGLGPTGA